KLNKHDVWLRVSNTKLKYLSPEEQVKVAELIYLMDDEARKEFSDLSPRFWTQGSFKYDTLNKPFHPGQEMDIDDGTYLPMPIFESDPKVGHTLLILLVDSALKSLAAERSGWVFETKRTCGRIKIKHEKTHIDVPMYAIPKDQFLKKEKAMKMAMNRSLILGSLEAEDAKPESYEVDTESVNLALRDGEKKWLNSDPKIVEDWFEHSRKRIGNHLPKVCRYLKAWRDVQWQVGGPSSISLMAAIVSILDTTPHNKDDFDATMKVITDNLHKEFGKGIESPDHTANSLLFPPLNQHTKREDDIMAKLEALPNILQRAENAISKQDALSIINTAFGHRVTKEELIVSAPAAPAFSIEPEPSSSAAKISSTMVSG
ncbi:hypothetical protein VII00023_22214, partial [Vibrio ichthyoenteri ATCC 700023]